MGTESEQADDETPLEQIVAGITIGAILTVAFGLLALGYPYFWVAFPIGFAGVLPAAIGLVKLYERRQATEGPASRPATAADDSLEVIRERYARGELSDEEFDHRLERLLETESPDRLGDSIARDEPEEYDFERT